MHGIATEDLSVTDVPPDDAPWDTIEEFALTFNGYEHWEDPDMCAQIANAKTPKNLNELRSCLFFEQRRFRHFGHAPEGEDMLYVLSLVSRIRSALVARTHGGAPPA